MSKLMHQYIEILLVIIISVWVKSKCIINCQDSNNRSEENIRGFQKEEKLPVRSCITITRKSISNILIRIIPSSCYQKDKISVNSCSESGCRSDTGTISGVVICKLDWLKETFYFESRMPICDNCWNQLVLNHCQDFGRSWGNIWEKGWDFKQN